MQIGYSAAMMQMYASQASMQVGNYMPMQASMGNYQAMMGMGMRYNAPYAMGWAGYMGGMNGMASMYGQMGMQGAMMMGGMSMPGPAAMQTTQMGGVGMMGQMDNTIEVAGKGMGKAKKYKMFAGELLAVHSILGGKKGKSMKPEALAKELKSRYGIDTELKKVDGKKALVNKATGHTIMRDGNGNSIMDKNDMDFKGGLKTIKEKFNITPEQFAQQYDKSQGGVGATTGMNVPQMGVGAIRGGGRGMQGMGTYPQLGGMYPFGMGGMGMTGAMGGIWGDPIWQNSIFGLMAGSMRYAGMYG